jgi:23S rRNA (pseudouridine1915-N3)-methyltransferase
VRVWLCTVGRLRRGPVAAAIREYEARAARYFRLEVISVRSAPPSAGAAAPDWEAAELLRRVPEDAELVALDPGGEIWTSAELARYLGDLAVRSRPGAAFLIGGAHGLGRAVLERAARRWSLSRLTLPHEIARLVVAEQIYRAGTILRGEPYHK